MRMNLEMTPMSTVLGSMLVFTAIVLAVVFFPWYEYEAQVEPSDIWRERTEIENQGYALFKANGCQYCHSQYVRPQDWDYGADRIAQAGDYVGDTPPLLGSERQGPDLSQEGGLRSDDWHHAHFVNPRYTRPESIMPPFEWLGMENIRRLTDYLQSLGYKDADIRMERQRDWKRKAIEAYDAGPDANMEWLHSHVPKQWMEMPNPYPATKFSLKRGEKIYFDFCISCHGEVGDGMGPGAPYMNPPPYNFSYLKRWEGPIGGMLYHQVMNGITGTAMMPFKTELESEKIWDVSNYVAVYFAGRPEFEEGPSGIPASYEPRRPEEEVEPGPDEE